MRLHIIILIPWPISCWYSYSADLDLFLVDIPFPYNLVMMFRIWKVFRIIFLRYGSPSKDSNLGSKTWFITGSTNATELNTVVMRRGQLSCPAIELRSRPLKLVVMVTKLARLWFTSFIKFVFWGWQRRLLEYDIIFIVWRRDNKNLRTKITQGHIAKEMCLIFLHMLDYLGFRIRVNNYNQFLRNRTQLILDFQCKHDYLQVHRHGGQNYSYEYEHLKIS